MNDNSDLNDGAMDMDENGSTSFNAESSMNESSANLNQSHFSGDINPSAQMVPPQTNKIPEPSKILGPNETTTMDKSSSTIVPEQNISDTWLTKAEVSEMRSRWYAIQVQFVDSPCSSVEQGDALVAEVMERFMQILTEKQNSLNQQWLNHDDISTEELRMTLQNYRTILNHLLAL